MCGRFSLFAELDELALQFGFAPTAANGDYQPSWNIAPTSAILAVTTDAGKRAGSVMRWGFTFSAGSRAGGGSSSRPLFNARSETLAERPAFRDAFARRRCLIPANGFYEWPGGGNGKTPVWVHRTDELPFALAGIYDVAPNAAASVITCAPNSLMRPIHSRMPVILDAGDYDAWLDPYADAGMLQTLLATREWPELTARPVSSAVNRAGSDGPGLVAPMADVAPRLF